MPDLRLTRENTLPSEGLVGTFIGRAWTAGGIPGPTPVLVSPDGVFSLAAAAPTVSALLELADPAEAARRCTGERLGDVTTLLENTPFDRRAPDRPWLLAPADLQAVKACGVTFLKSMLERVV